MIADLAREGFVSFPSAAHLKYDLVVDVGSRLLRGQVKGTTTPRGKLWRFHTDRTTRGGYGSGAFDFYAFVIVPTRQILYMLPADVKCAELHVPAYIMTTVRTNAKYSKLQEPIDYPFKDILRRLKCSSAA